MLLMRGVAVGREYRRDRRLLDRFFLDFAAGSDANVDVDGARGWGCSDAGET